MNKELVAGLVAIKKEGKAINLDNYFGSYEELTKKGTVHDYKNRAYASVMAIYANSPQDAVY
jgi:hypothetical protein